MAAKVLWRHSADVTYFVYILIQPVEGARKSIFRFSFAQIDIKMPKYYCIVPQCTVTCPDKLFFTVPKDTKRRKQWFLACRRQSFPAAATVCQVCEDHFAVSIFYIKKVCSVNNKTMFLNFITLISTVGVWCGEQTAMGFDEAKTKTEERCIAAQVSMSKSENNNIRTY